MRSHSSWAACASWSWEGGVNAVLVARFLLPCSKVAPVLGGVLYAVFWPAIYSERTLMLQVLANTCLLASLIAISPAESPPTRRRFVIAGVLLGFGAVIKIWGLLPVLILFGWVLARFDGQRHGGVPAFLRRSARTNVAVGGAESTAAGADQQLADRAVDRHSRVRTLAATRHTSAGHRDPGSSRRRGSRVAGTAGTSCSAAVGRHGGDAVAHPDLVRPLRRFERPGDCHHGWRGWPAAAVPRQEMAATSHRCRRTYGHRCADGCASPGTG